MRIAMIGLGRMGGNMTRRLLRGGVEVVGYDRSMDVALQLAEEEGMLAAESLAAAVDALAPPRTVWLMLPAGEPTEEALAELRGLLAPGDLVVDGGNANYRESQRHAAEMSALGIDFIDAGTSGGVWGLENGYCLMVGGEAAAVERLRPALVVLAPDPVHGWLHAGPTGAGHFTKMVHNGIEYGMMQAMAEGLELLRGKSEFQLDLAAVSELWRHGSVVRSWLLDLTAAALAENPQLEGIAPVVADSGEGRWTVQESIEQGVALPVITLALQMRFASQDTHGYQGRLLSAMRNAFGGHLMVKE